MKIYSNIPIPQIQRWKEGQFLITINHKDNGELVDSGQRYEADATISKSLLLPDLKYAFQRMINDPELDQKVIDNIQENGVYAIDVVKEYPELPVEVENQIKSIIS